MSVTVVFKSVALGTAGGKGQHRVQAIQGLDGSLLIYAEHRRMPGWIQVQADDIGRFGLEFRVIAGHVALQPMRLQAGFFPGAINRGFADPHDGCQLAATPVCRSIARFLARRRQDPGPQRRRQDAGGLTGMMRIQSIHAKIQKACLPADDGRRRGVQLPFDGAERCTFSEHQDQLSPKYISGRKRTGLSDAAQLTTLIFAQHNIIARHVYIDAVPSSNVYSGTVH